MLVVPSHAALAHNDQGRTLVRVLAGEITRFSGFSFDSVGGVHDVGGAFVACRLNTVFSLSHGMYRPSPCYQHPTPYIFRSAFLSGSNDTTNQSAAKGE